MKPSNLTRRLEALERREESTPSPATAIPAGPSDARRRMLYHLAQVVRFRRGQLPAEEVAELEASNAALESRLSETGGGGAYR